MHKGSCLCQRIKYEIDGELGDFGYCHCTSCRKASGAPHGANSPVDRARFRLVQGVDSLREYESSPGKLRAFCGHCGSPIYAYLTASRDVLRLRLGSLDTPFDKPDAPSGNPSQAGSHLYASVLALAQYARHAITSW